MTRTRTLIGGLVLAALTAPGVATATTEAPLESGWTCITNAEVHPVTGPAVEQTVCVANGIVAWMGDGLPSTPHHVVDGTDHVLTPGLVEVNSELGVTEIGAVPDTRDGDAGVSDEIRAAFRAGDAFNPQSTLIPLARASGITSTIVAPRGGFISGQGLWVDLAASRDIRTMYVRDARPMIFASFGPNDHEDVGSSRASAMLRYRELLADVMAFMADPAAYDAAAMRELSASRLDLEAMAGVVTGETLLVLRVNRRADLRAALDFAGEEALDIAILGGGEAWAEAASFAASGVPVAVNPLLNLPAGFSDIGAREDTAARLHAAGAPVIISGGDTHNIRNLRQLAGNAVRAGMPWDAALEAITLAPARLAGLGDTYGAIEVGRVANLVLWDGDPFELSSAATHVWIQGEAQPLEHRQGALFERYRDSR